MLRLREDVSAPRFPSHSSSPRRDVVMKRCLPFRLHTGASTEQSLLGWCAWFACDDAALISCCKLELGRMCMAFTTRSAFLSFLSLSLSLFIEKPSVRAIDDTPQAPDVVTARNGESGYLGRSVLLPIVGAQKKQKRRKKEGEKKGKLLLDFHEVPSCSPPPIGLQSITSGGRSREWSTTLKIYRGLRSPLLADDDDSMCNMSHVLGVEVIYFRSERNRLSILVPSSISNSLSTRACPEFPTPLPTPELVVLPLSLWGACRTMYAGNPAAFPLKMSSLIRGNKRVTEMQRMLQPSSSQVSSSEVMNVVDF